MINVLKRKVFVIAGLCTLLAFIHGVHVLMPLFIVDEVVEKVKDGTISGYYYDPDSVALVSRKLH